MGKHRSGHSYQEFPILNVARRCGLVLNDRTLEWEEVEASCPFCGDHGPGKHHLFLNTTRNVFRCVLCGEKGNSVSLYAKMEGLSNRQAFRALSEDSVLYRFPQQPLSQKPAEREPSSLAVRHNVYYDMLMHLELSPKHKADLLARGLSEERIEQNMYRTLPMSSSARRFLAGILSDFHNLEGVPGFYVDRGYWNILGHSGLLVPCRDRNGYIQGLQIRLDDETKPDRKYRWLSSRGKAHGTRSYSYIHVTGNIHARTAYLTEGGLKGDVASFLDHDALFLCFAGVTAIAGLKDALQSMENLEEVVVALDMDKLVNWRVRNALGKIMETVQSIPNLRVRLMNWNMTFKGVDDFYKARNEAASKGVNILDMVMQEVNHQLFTETVLEEVLISMEEPDTKQAEEILSRLDLLPFRDRHPMSLSGGQKQRVAIASAIASKRSILFFDEPTSGLDYWHMKEVAAVLRQLSTEGVTVYVITHDLELLLDCCTDIIHFAQGNIAGQYPMDAGGLSRVCAYFMGSGA